MQLQRDCTSGQSNREWPPSDNLKCIQRGTENLHFEIKARRRLKTCWYALQIIPQQVRSRYGEGGAELQKKVILHLNSVHIVFDPWHRKFTLCNLLHRLININIQDQLSSAPLQRARNDTRSMSLSHCAWLIWWTGPLLLEAFRGFCCSFHPIESFTLVN